MIKPYISILITIAVLGGVVWYYSNNQQRLDSFFAGLFSKSDAQIESIGVINDEFVIQGKDLSTVELWVIPSGTEITESQNIKLGNAELQNRSEIGEVWVYPIPKEPLLITGIYAKGFNNRSREIGRVDFPVIGTTDIYNALWGRNTTSENSKELVLKSGEKGVFESLTLTFNDIVQDSRCPIDVQCIQAGELVVNLNLKEGAATRSIVLSSTETLGKDFAGYNILMGEIEPTKTVSVNPENTTYAVHFLVTKLQ